MAEENAGTSRQLNGLTKRLQVERVFFHGPVYGNAKTIVFQQADLFVLPSRSENFGIAVAESLAHGVPAIVSHGAPWSGLADHACGWWIETGVAPLYECLQHVLQLSRPTLVAMGQRGRDWMSREFSWSRIAEHDVPDVLLVVGRRYAPRLGRDECHDPEYLLAPCVSVTGSVASNSRLESVGLVQHALRNVNKRAGVTETSCGLRIYHRNSTYT